MTSANPNASRLLLGLAVALAVGTSARAAEPMQIQYRQDDRGYRQDDRGYRQDEYRDQRRYDDRRGDENVPGGSYLRSCGEARREGSTLVAVCRGNRGARFETSIDLSRCGRSEVGNNNGNLQCGQVRGISRRVD